MNQNNSQEITYEQFIAGALLTFSVIDNLDFSLLIKDFETKTGIKLDESWEIADTIGKYLKYEGGTISLNDITLFHHIDSENCSLRELLKKVAGPFICTYFDNLNLDAYDKTKNSEAIKNNILENVNVLLISEEEEEYEALKKYGFANVDYFKSLIIANDYFTKFPNYLHKYHVIITGESSIRYCCFGEYVPLESTIRELEFENKVVTTCFSEDYNTNQKIIYLADPKNNKHYDVKADTYETLIDELLKNLIINETLTTAKVLSNIPPYKEYVNPNLIPLPKTKKDLKILYLSCVNVNKYAPVVAKNLGLNITFMEDNNNTLGKIKDKLGDYDIIIASRIYSGSILRMFIESTEQCKSTGRRLVMLATYEDDSISNLSVDDEWIDSIGCDIELKYLFAGPISTSHETSTTDFKVLIKPEDFISETEYRSFYEEKVAVLTSVIRSITTIYNDNLISMSIPNITDLEPKHPEDFTKEYEAEYQKQEERKEAILAPITNFDNFVITIKNYLYYKRKGLITKEPKDLKIIQEKDDICIINIYQGRTMCIFVILKQNEYLKNLRMFCIQTLTKKGTITPLETVGIYTKKYENGIGVPRRLNEKEETALLSTMKKVNHVLDPLNEEAWQKHLAREKELRRVRKDSKK